MRMTLALLLALLVSSGQPAARSLDPERSEVRFTVTKLGFSDVSGGFRTVSGDVHYDEARPENSSVRWRVRVASVQTGEGDRDRALQAPEYFDASRHPELSFESRSVRPAGGRLEVTGEITIRGITRRITIPVHIGERSGRRAFVTDFELDRYDFGVRGGRVMGNLIGRTVRVHLVAVEGGTA